MTRLNRRRLIFVGLGLLVLLTALAFSLRDVVREVIVIPLSYLFWVIGIFIDSTPQIFFWLALLLISLLAAGRAIRPNKKAVEVRFRTDSMVPANAVGRVGYWVSRVNTLRLGSFYKQNFNQSLNRLLLDMLSYRHHLTTRQVEQAIRNGSLYLPQDIAAFVKSNTRDLYDAQANIFTWIFHAIREWFTLRLGRTPQNTETLLTPEVRRVITYMEEELEVTYEQSGN
jgi:hypothetical protein